MKNDVGAGSCIIFVVLITFIYWQSVRSLEGLYITIMILMIIFGRAVWVLDEKWELKKT